MDGNMSRSAKGPNHPTPSLDAARESLRLSLEEFHAVAEEWGATHSAADSSRISSISKRMLPHMITLAADTHEVRDIVDLIGIFSDATNFNPDATIALVSRLLGTFDAENAARSQWADATVPPAEQEPKIHSGSEGYPSDGGDTAKNTAPQKRGRPIKISIERKMRALHVASPKEQAQILYNTPSPTRRQQQDVPSVMKNFIKHLPKSAK
jgi:hypothetical protein